MRILDFFTDFMNLSYTVTKQADYKPVFKDIDLGDYRILRKEYSYKIIYLTNGSYIKIPRSLVNLFNALNTYGGDRIINLVPLDDIENIIYQFMMLLYAINTQRTDRIIEIAYSICELGTKGLIQYCKDKFGIELDPIEFNTLDKELII